LGHAPLPCFVPDVSANIVESLGCPLTNVKRVDAKGGVGTAFCDHFADPSGPVGTDQADLGVPLVAQQVEELVQGHLVPANGSPDEATGIVVHRDSQVPVTALVADLSIPIRTRPSKGRGLPDPPPPPGR